MPRKIRQLKSELTQNGFILLKKRGKGSHSVWKHPLLPGDRLVIPGKDGDDVKDYLEKEVREKIDRLKQQEDKS
jgi:predicted RNA binding protein YcfA (HicA-like mRNA interferase family)